MHWEAVKRTLKYIQQTKDISLVYSITEVEKFVLKGFSDSDWGNCPDSFRSTTGYVFQLGGNTITWQSKRQPTVALSSAEAETMAAIQAVKEGIWTRRVLREMNISAPYPLNLYMDNKAAIQIAKHPASHNRTKHIGLQTQFLREMVEQKFLSLYFVPTEKQKADALTKALPPIKVKISNAQLGLIEVPEEKRERKEIENKT